MDDDYKQNIFPSALSEFLITLQDLLREWEEQARTVTHDPTALFHQMAEILEKETNAFIAGDPDPFEVGRALFCYSLNFINAEEAVCLIGNDVFPLFRTRI